MKLKVSTSPYTYFLLLMTIMDTGYFVLLNIPGLRDTGYMRIGFLIIATLLAMNCYINKNIYRTLQPYYNYLNVFILYLVVFYFSHFISSSRKPPRQRIPLSMCPATWVCSC